MFRFIKKNWEILAILLISFVIFYPSLFGFFANDDFFFLKIAHISSPKEFFNFFNLVKDVGVIGVYRPLTLRVFYFLGVSVFHLNPILLHIISFVTFFVDIVLVKKLVNLLTKNNKVALLSSFLYAVSVTHFGQLYYIGAYQELFLTMVFLSSTILFIKYELNIKTKNSAFLLIASFLFFILGIMSKETAVVLPFILIFTHIYLKITKRIKVTTKTLVISLLPFFAVLGVYLFLHFRYFGVISGDSYVWNFSLLRAINSLVWYFLWSLNIPETLVDFVGPGFHLNPNLFKYWSKEIIPILTLFVIQVSLIVYAFFKSKILKQKSLLIFSVTWFVVTLAPVLFLPVHKFTYYLTLPLIGVVLLLAYLFQDSTAKGHVVFKLLFCIVWTATSLMSLSLSYETNWITQSGLVASRVNEYIKNNVQNFDGKKIYFVDTTNDSNLPWSPTATVKTALSDKNFFDVFYPDLSAKVSYANPVQIENSQDIQIIGSRQFLGY